MGNLRTEDLAALADELLEKLRVDEERAHMTPEERAARDAERRRRDEEQLAEDAALRRRLSIEATLSCLPPKLGREIPTVDLTATDWPATLAAVDWWSANKSRVLLIRGAVGGGKSTAAAAVSRVYAESVAGKHRGVGLSWLRTNDFVSAVLHQYDDDAPRLGRDLVVVDDVGLETRPDFEQALCVFIDDYDARLVMTTNLTKEAFRERYGARVVDRLLECGSAITIKGESRRRKNGEF